VTKALRTNVCTRTIGPPSRRDTSGKVLHNTTKGGTEGGISGPFVETGESLSLEGSLKSEERWGQSVWWGKADAARKTGI